MTNSEKSGIYLIVEFDWPRPFETKNGALARELHDIVQGEDWIREILAASGGLGSGRSSVWVFWLENYAALDRLLTDQEEPIANANGAFFSAMDNVQDKIREEVRFRKASG